MLPSRLAVVLLFGCLVITQGFLSPSRPRSFSSTFTLKMSDEDATAAPVTSIKTRLAADMKEAMKSKQKERLAAVRSIQAAIKQREVDDRVALTDDDIVALMTKLVKMRKESIKSYSDAGRQDLVASEEAELSFFADYLPKPMTEEEVKKVIEDVVTKLGATSIKDMGKVMAELRPIVAGKADAAEVGTLVKQRLGGK